VARVRAIGPAKSAAVLLGPTVGATTAPVATAQLAIKPCVPWRREAYAGRSTSPGCLGTVGAARSSAWLPVCSSVRMTCPPCLATAGAGWSTAHTATTGSAHATGSSGLALSQSSTRGGGQAACLSKPPDPAGADRLAHPSLAHRIGDLAGRPVPERPPGIRGVCTRHRDPLDPLCRRHRGRRARAGVSGQRRPDHRGAHGIMAPIGFPRLQRGGKRAPSLAPCLSRPALAVHLARHVARAGSRLQRSKNLGTPSQPLGTRLPARHLLQAGPLSCGQRPPGGCRGGWRNGGGHTKRLSGDLGSFEPL
jgi:hypothetical protein